MSDLKTERESCPTHQPTINIKVLNRKSSLFALRTMKASNEHATVGRRHFELCSRSEHSLLDPFLGYFLSLSLL